MKAIQWLTAAVIALPTYCFASLINAKIDYFSEPFVYGNHINLTLEADTSGDRINWLNAISGTIETEGEIFTLTPTSLKFTDQKSNSDWDWAITNIYAGYTDSKGASHSIWAHLEGNIASYTPEAGPTLGDTFVQHLKESKNPMPARYSVSVPESMSWSLLLAGVFIMLFKNGFSKPRAGRAKKLISCN